MRSTFEHWLLAGGKTPRAAQDYVSRLDRVARAYGDIDSHFAKDRCVSLLRDLAYSAADKDRGAPNRSRIRIDGDAYNGLATLRSAVRKYVEFRKA
jgi:hypothetical protein